MLYAIPIFPRSPVNLTHFNRPNLTPQAYSIGKKAGLKNLKSLLILPARNKFKNNYLYSNREMHLGYWLESRKEGDHWEDQGVSGWTILKWISET
jgi:hypothetical protein